MTPRYTFRQMILGRNARRVAGRRGEDRLRVVPVFGFAWLIGLPNSIASHSGRLTAGVWWHGTTGQCEGASSARRYLLDRYAGSTNSRKWPCGG